MSESDKILELIVVIPPYELKPPLTYKLNLERTIFDCITSSKKWIYSNEMKASFPLTTKWFKALQIAMGDFLAPPSPQS